ncbi:MAG TPA: protein translocase subunit SecF [Trebonia sp.]|nr:protein translocase subunit SecF [Trebonia sp.]
MMSRLGQLGGRLYRGEVSVNFVGRQRMWYTISGIILVVSIAALLVKGLNFSVEFKGGSIFQFPATASATQNEISRVVTEAGGGDSTVQHIATRLLSEWQVQTGTLSANTSQQVATALENTFHIQQSQMTIQLVGPTWGSQITTKAFEALIIFLVVIVIYLSIAFEWKMAVAAFVALLHDIVITVGVYALTGFQVSPTSVIGLLTILGYSLYDTVVVFDKVRENTAGLLTSHRSTYSQAANLALNQTLVRSINTSVTALLPVASILFVGAGLLGAGTLKDLSLVLFVGMLSGTYSSICIATPVLADLKEREPQYKELAKRVRLRESGGRAARRAAAAAGTASTTAIGTAEPEPAEDTAQEPVEPTAAPQAEAPDQEDDEVTVSAASGPAPAARRVPATSRQQPRRGSSAQRRPGAKKKRR